MRRGSPIAPENTQAWVLAGGLSSRMGRDKALLQREGITLLEGTIAKLAGVVQHTTVIGPPERYPFLNVPVVADLIPGCGPISGLHTALTLTQSDWNLLVACDMPNLTANMLRAMLLATPNTAAHDTNSKCLVAQDLHGGLHPLCAVYHRDLLPAVANRIEHKWFKLQDLLKEIDAQAFSIADVSLLANINTPAQWETV